MKTEEPYAPSVFAVQSHNLAIYLVARGYPLTVRVQPHKNRCEFVFPYSEAVAQDAESYYKRTALIPPQAFLRARKDVARLMSEAKGKQ